MLRKFSSLLILSITLVLSILLTACSSANTTSPPAIEYITSNHSTIYLDEETDVMYLARKNGGLSKMFNTDGSPKLGNESKYDTVVSISMAEKGLKIYVDIESDVMYLVRTDLPEGGVTMMVNADGSPRLSSQTKHHTIDILYDNILEHHDDDNLFYHHEYDLPILQFLVDTETNNMFLFSNAGCGGLAQMFNSNGTPKLSTESKYTEYKFTYEISSLGGIDSDIKIYRDIETDNMFLYVDIQHCCGLTNMFNTNVSQSQSTKTQYDFSNIEQSGSDGITYIVDEEANVMYLASKGGGLTCMYDREFSKTE